MSEHDRWTEQAASYVLDALDDPERSAFEAHLGGCERCRQDVASYTDTVYSLGAAVPLRTPPAALRERILTTARASRPAASSTAASSAAASPGAASPAVRTARRLPDWLALAAVLAALLASGLWIAERRAHLRFQAELAQTTAQLDDARGRAAVANEQIRQLDELTAALLAPDVRAASLSGAGRPPSARLYWSPAQRQIVLAAFDLPPAPAGRTYQLWGLRGGRAFSLGTFDTGADGRVRLIFPVPAGEQLDLGAVTEEPAGGSPQPTSAPFLTGAIPAQQ